MHNHDDKYPSRPGFEPGTPRLQAPVDMNEASGPANAVSRSTQSTANMRRCPNVGLLLGQRRRRWANSKSTSGQRLMFAGNLSHVVLHIILLF